MLTVNGAIRAERQRFVVRHKDDSHTGVELSALPVVGDDPDCRSKVTRGVRQMMCRMNLDAGSFADAASLLEEMAQINSSTERLRQVVEHEGKAVQRLQQTEPLPPAWSAEDCRVDAEDAHQLLLPFRPTRVYTGCDGVMVPRVTEAEKHKRREAVKAKRRRRRRRQPDAERPAPLPPHRRGSDHPWKELKLVHHYDQHAEHSHVSTTSADHRVAGAVIARDARNPRRPCPAPAAAAARSTPEPSAPSPPSQTGPPSPAYHLPNRPKLAEAGRPSTAVSWWILDVVTTPRVHRTAVVFNSTHPDIPG